MKYTKILFVVLVALVEIQTKELDPGPQAVVEGNSSTTVQAARKRYATKEVILYLTPTQIKDLQSGKAYISPYTLPKSAVNQQDTQKELIFKEHDNLIREQFENIKAAKVVLPAEVSQAVNFEQISQQQNDALLQQTTLKQLQSSLRDEWHRNKPELQSDTLLSLSSAKNQEESPLLHEQLNKESNPILERIQFNTWLSLESQHQKPDEDIEIQKPLLQLQYGPKYNDQKNAIEIEKLIRERHQEELNRHSALTRAEAIVNSPPLLIHREVKITKNHHVPVVKSVKVPIPTPVLIPVPEPYKVNVPQPYPVPLGIIKHIPVPIVGVKNIELEKPVPFEFRKQLSFPLIRQGLFKENRPHNVEKFAPVEITKTVPENTFSRKVPVRKAEKVTILRPIWKH